MSLSDDIEALEQENLAKAYARLLPALQQARERLQYAKMLAGVIGQLDEMEQIELSRIEAEIKEMRG